MGEEETLRIIVLGRVQGVGFRYFTQKTALQLGVNGWVRNRMDGSVEILAQFSKIPSGQKRSFLNAIQKGPSMSRVDSLEISKVSSLPETGFFIRNQGQNLF